MFGLGKKNTQETPDQPLAHIYQEFYCTKSGGGCGGYVVIKLRMTLNERIEFTCPKCNHKHRRTVKSGRIVEEGRFDAPATIDLFPTMSAYSTEPRHNIDPKDRSDERNAMIFASKQDVRDPVLAELWFEYHGGT